jgi:hypothetical protein
MNRPKIFMDSGAYSAETKGAKIDLEKYCAFLRSEGAAIDVAAPLDVIGDPIASYANFERMLKLGTTPLPAYHQGEPVSWLMEYVRRFDYIALGGAVGTSPVQQRMWLDEIWATHLTDKDGWPVVKVHGFGITSTDVMARYPWYSVDSTTWLMGGSMGRILVNWDGGLVSVNVREDSPDMKAEGHIDAMNANRRHERQQPPGARRNHRERGVRAEGQGLRSQAPQVRGCHPWRNQQDTLGPPGALRSSVLVQRQSVLRFCRSVCL